MKKDFFQILAAASIVVSLTLFAGGCAKQKVKTDSGMTETSEGAGAGMKADTGEGMGKEESLSSTGWDANGRGAIIEGRTTGPMLPLYFDFDKSNIRDDQQDRMKKNGEFLLETAGTKVRVEGNCDERGTNEYNMALGERRAINGKKYLVNMGVAESRIDTISYGEEKPLNYGHDELAWSQNRRDDFVISK
ncbi:MAG: peptidoglycan-associated lipoprotein Pal [Desulfobulbaceae bacterium]|nr:peptidoglycan-associated lipoprotein Pal [Desulfobulbaceae bacterium]HIJ77864.1 peptidoglycan-associated lipoprotein Pal [Deltaproteobacteria bacterium]